jgi:hypothetical protein
MSHISFDVGGDKPVVLYPDCLEIRTFLIDASHNAMDQMPHRRHARR